MKFATYIIFKALVLFFRLIPFPLLYVLSDILKFILKNIFKYRISVIKANISFCFPNLTQVQVKNITNKYYKNFIDIALESIKGLTYSPKKLINRYKLTNSNILDNHFRNGQSIIVLSQHLNNWEWGSICLGLQTNHHIVGVMKTISNPYINKMIIDGRTGNNVSVVSTGQTLHYILGHKPKKPEAIFFIADQYPRNKHFINDVDFFNRKIAFNSGASKLAKRKQFPIYTINMIRKSRGKYQLEFIKLFESTDNVSVQEITQAYSTQLQNLITKYPDAWLWSHKRFKDNLDY